MLVYNTFQDILGPKLRLAKPFSAQKWHAMTCNFFAHDSSALSPSHPFSPALFLFWILGPLETTAVYRSFHRKHTPFLLSYLSFLSSSSLISFSFPFLLVLSVNRFIFFPSYPFSPGRVLGGCQFVLGVLCARLMTLCINANMQWYITLNHIITMFPDRFFENHVFDVL